MSPPGEVRGALASSRGLHGTLFVEHPAPGTSVGRTHEESDRAEEATGDMEGVTAGRRYAYADTGTVLVQGCEASLAPSGQSKRLSAAGWDRGDGWVNTSGLGRPDRVVHVRGTDTVR